MLIYLSLLDTAEERNKFEQLYNRYRYTMLYTANSILQDQGLAEDAVHGAFIRIAKNFGKIGDVDSPRTRGFVVVVTKNVAITMYNRQKGIVITEDESAINHVADSNADDIFSRISYESIVQQIISLPDIYKEVMYLCLVNEMKIKQVSQLLHLPEETVKKRLQRGRKVLAERLEKEGITYE